MLALTRIALQLVTDLFRLAVLLCRPTRSVRAENLFLRRQLALFKERAAPSLAGSTPLPGSARRSWRACIAFTIRACSLLT